MIGVITGDIICSRKSINQQKWLQPLKSFLGQMGSQPAVWDIFRGDSFHLEVKIPEDTLAIALRIKALVKSASGFNIRMAIGIGKKDYISESNGQAYVFSVETYETLKKKGRTLAVQSPWTDFNRSMNATLRLATIITDSWSKTNAEYINLRLENPTLTQVQLSSILGVSQSAVSARHTRSHWDEIMEMERVYREIIQQKLKNK